MQLSFPKEQFQFCIQQIFEGKYLKIQQLTQYGSNKKVFLAKDIITQKNVLIKLIREKNISEDLLKKIREQANLLISFQHTNIAKLYKYSEYVSDKQQNIIVLVTEDVVGSSLLFNNSFAGLTRKQINIIYQQLIQTLQYIHARGIVHGDITLNNIIFDKNKNVKLRGLGITQLSIQLNFENKKQPSYYESPELCSRNNIKKEIDLWQLGIVMLELATGKTIKEIIERNGYKHPSINHNNFPGTIFTKYDVLSDMQILIKSLLENDVQVRKYSEINLEKGFQENFTNKQDSLLNLTLNAITDSQLENKLSLIIMKNHIKQLNLSNNLITDASANIIVKLHQLEKLNVNGNNLTDDFIHIIADPMLPWLTQLHIGLTNITDISLFLITQYGHNIESLDVSYTRLTSKSVITLTKLLKLNSLFIYSNYNSNSFPSRYNYARINRSKLICNTIPIDKQCITQLQKLRLKQLTINLQSKDSNQILQIMNEDATSIQVNGKISKQNLQKIMKMKNLKKIYLDGVRDGEITQFASESFDSIGLVGCSIKVKDKIEWLARCNNLTSLDLSSNYIGDQGVNQIVTNIKNLTILILNYNNIRDQGAIAIAKKFQNLKELDLSDNKIGNPGAISIATHLKHLLLLDLNYNEINTQGAIAIANNLKKLKILFLCNNQIGMQGATQIAIQLTDLYGLDLCQNGIENQGAIMIATHLKNIVELELSGDNIEDQGAIIIASQLKYLRTLALWNNKIGVKGGISIATNLLNLTTLALSKNNINIQVVTTIANNLKNLTALFLAQDNIDSKGIAILATPLNNIRILNLYQNNIGDEGAVAIALGFDKLKILDLSQNHIENEGVIAISARLSNLEMLNLDSNNLQDEAAVSIATRLNSLNKLSLVSNRLGNLSAIAISTHLNKLTFLTLKYSQENNNVKTNIFSPQIKQFIKLVLKDAIIYI